MNLMVQNPEVKVYSESILKHFSIVCLTRTEQFRVIVQIALKVRETKSLKNQFFFIKIFLT